MTKELTCKYCGYEHYTIKRLDQSGRYVLFLVGCGNCGEHMIPVRVEYGSRQEDVYSECLLAWNNENIDDKSIRVSDSKELNDLLLQPDPSWEAWKRTIPETYWARYDLSAVKLGWSAAMELVLPDSPVLGGE